MTTRRVLLTVIAALLAIALAALGVVVAVLGSEHGARWSLQLAQERIPQLSVEDIHGDWLRGLHLTQLQWRDANTDVSVRDIDARLHWPSLLYGEIKLSTLHAAELRIEPKGESDDKPIKLPLLFLPITLAASDFAVQKLLIVNRDTTIALDNIAAAVRWRATTLRAKNLHVSWENVNLQAGGEIGFRGDYSVRLEGELRVPQLAALSTALSTAPIALKTDGDLRRLIIHATTAAPYALRGDITLATLDKHLPLTIDAAITQPIVQTLPTGVLTINTATLNAHGDLNRIEATLNAALNEPHYGATQLTAAAQWQPEQLHATAQWKFPNSGEFNTECTTTLNESLPTNCIGAANTIALTPWLNGSSGDISSTFKLDASRRDQDWALALQLPDIRGQIDAEKFTGQLDLASADGAQWQVRKLELSNGPNKLSGSGKFGTQTQAQIVLDAGNLARLYPQLAGSLNAKLNLDGQWPQPDVRVQWSGTRLRFQQTLLERTSGEINLRKLGIDNSQLRVDAQQLVYAGHAPLDLTLSLSGKRTQQELVLVLQQTVQQRAQRVRLQCNTQPASNWLDWQISCPALAGSVHIDSIHENWQNDNPISGRLTLESLDSPAADSAYRVSAAELKPFCLRGKDTELCLDQALRYARDTLQPVAVHGSGLPLRWLAAWLPNDLQLQNDARATLQVRLQNVAPLRADAHLEIANTQWSWLTATGAQTAAINAIAVNATLDEKLARLSASANSPTLGSLNAQLAISDPRDKRELDGRIQLEHIQLAGFAVFVPDLDTLNGEINGDLRIGGSTKAPQLHGQLLLKDGTASWGPLGAPFRTINADLTFDNNNAKLGGWFALGQGGGDIDGSIHWDGAGDNWQAQIKLIAGGLSASPLPRSTIVFSPHIETTATPGEVHVTGYVDVASAEFELKQLPPHTTDVSQDQRLVGDENDAKTKLWADLRLNLGEQFHFQGLGADVNLSGRLQIVKKPSDALHVTGEVRVPRGRYRAYGQRLTVRKGSFIFYGPLENPDLNLEAVRDLPPGVTDVVGLRVIGSLKTPEALLFSEPSMPDSDIAYYLLTGRKPAANANTGGYSASGALLSLGMAGSESTAVRLAGKFGIRDLQLGTSETSAGNTEAEVSGQLSDDLQIRYGRDIGQRANSVSFQYRLTPKLVIETISGIEDALDLLYSFEVK